MINSEVLLSVTHFSLENALVIIRRSVGRANRLHVRWAVVNAYTTRVVRSEGSAHREVVARDVDTGIEIWKEGEELSRREAQGGRRRRRRRKKQLQQQKQEREEEDKGKEKEEKGGGEEIRVAE